MQACSEVRRSEALGEVSLMNATGFLCGPRLYEFEGWFFEDHAYCGPWPLRKDAELRKRAGRTFYAVYDRFNKLSKEDKQKYRVGGGCLAF